MLINCASVWSVSPSQPISLERRSDREENLFVVIERYRSKADYMEIHRRSAAMHEFRPVMKKMENAGMVVVNGHSFTETGLGFV